MEDLIRLAKRSRRNSELRVSWTPQEGRTLGSQPEVISGDDLREYLLQIKNPGSDNLNALKLFLNFPYPVEKFDYAQGEGSSGELFKPYTQMVATTRGGGYVSSPGIRYADYELDVTELRPNGVLELRIVLNSWRDPRGKENQIKPEEMHRYFVPETGPLLTYLYGHYKRQAGDESVNQDIYAPFELREDKTVVMGTPVIPPPPDPKTLVVRGGFS